MEEIKEIIQPLKEASSVLITANPERINTDLLSGYFALFYTLKKIGKVVKPYPSNIFEYFKNLPFPLHTLKTFCIKINQPNGLISDLYYQKDNSNLKIFLTLIDGDLNHQNLQLIDLQNASNFDIIVTLGMQYLEDLGEFYERNFKLFFTTPILNLDNSPSNSEFGQINLVETQQSISEICYTLIKNLNENLIDKPTATNLLGGLLSFYKNKNNKVKPSIFYSLLKKEGDLQKLCEFFQIEPSISKKLTSFLEKMEVNSEIAFINPPSELHYTKEEIIKIISLLRANFLNLSSFCLFLPLKNIPPQFQVVFYHPDLEILQKVLQYFKGETNKKMVLFDTSRKPEIVKKELLQIIYG